MIVDITNEILTELKRVIVDVKILTSYQSSTSEFPTIIFEEMDNSAYMGTKDSGGFNHSNIAFSLEIYTIGKNKMTQAKKIRNQVDEVMSGTYGLQRGVPIIIPNYLDGSIYRYRLVYSGLIDENKKIYRG